MSVYNPVIFKDFNLTPRAKKAYKDAHETAKKIGHSNINNMHVFYGCIKNASEDFDLFMQECGVDTARKKEFLSIIKKAKLKNDEKFFANPNSDPWHLEVLDAVGHANKISNELGQHYIGIEHILLGIINTSPYVFGEFDDFVFDVEDFKKDLENFVCFDFVKENKGKRLEDVVDSSGLDLEDIEKDLNNSGEEAQSQNSPMEFITNFNSLYIEGKLPDIYGREKEVDVLIETISKKNKCNAILTGDAGVGKTSIIEALASRICKADIPTNLIGAEVLGIDLGSMLAGTQYRGQFEQKFKSLLNMAKENPHMILFFDEIHTIFGAGGNQEGGLDAANMLKPFLARGEIKCIGATTSKEYTKIFEKDGAMKRRFLNIKVEEPSKEETKKILYSCKKKYEKFHNVKFSKPCIDYIVDISANLISDKKFPDKAFDIMDQAGARVKIKNFKTPRKIVNSHDKLMKFFMSGETDEIKIKENFESFMEDIKQANKENTVEVINMKKSDIISIVSEQSNVSIKQIQNNKGGFSSFLNRISKEVFGQNEELQKINDLLSCAKVGLSDENKPLASMFFVGPTSVGKTYTAKKIAKHFFGNEKAIIQINMGELHDKTGINKLIGANSGYVGYEEGGSLTKFVKNNPNCVVLFDEIEKADPQVLNILLNILDEGYIEDNKHDKINFSKSIVILTSNIGNEKASKKSMGFIQDEEPKSDSFKKSVKSKLKPELIARINEIIVFNDLCGDDIKRIINYELSIIKSKLSLSNININYTAKSIDCIFNDIKNKNLHARDIKNYIREKIQVPAAKIIVENKNTLEISIKNVDNKVNVC